MSSVRNIAISEELCRAAEARFARRFRSVEELVTELLTNLLNEDAVQMDEREQQILEERLKALGYV
jgi:plasmid stability protein